MLIRVEDIGLERQGKKEVLLQSVIEGVNSKYVCERDTQLGSQSDIPSVNHLVQSRNENKFMYFQIQFFLLLLI